MMRDKDGLAFAFNDLKEVVACRFRVVTSSVRML